MAKTTDDGQLGTSGDENGRSRLVQPEIFRGDVISFYAYSARLLLFARSCASSDSASLPLRYASVTSSDSLPRRMVFIDANCGQLPSSRQLSRNCVGRWQQVRIADRWGARMKSPQQRRSRQFQRTMLSVFKANRNSG
jgi:hypothetical protein